MSLNIKLIVKLTLNINTPQKEEEEKHLTLNNYDAYAKYCQSQAGVCRLTLCIFPHASP